MNRPPIVGDTIHYQTEIDAQGKVRAIHASIEGVPKQMTLESMVKKAGQRRTPTNRVSPIPLHADGQLIPEIGLSVCRCCYSSSSACTPTINYGSRNTLTSNQSTMQAMPSSTPPEPSFQCEGRVYCSQMSSLEEAEFYLKNCPGTQMDGDHDGEPCEQQF